MSRILLHIPVCMWHKKLMKELYKGSFRFQINGNFTSWSAMTFICTCAKCNRELAYWIQTVMPPTLKKGRWAKEGGGAPTLSLPTEKLTPPPPPRTRPNSRDLRARRALPLVRSVLSGDCTLVCFLTGIELNSVNDLVGLNGYRVEQR